MRSIYIEEGRGNPVLWDGSKFSPAVRFNVNKEHMGQKIEKVLESFVAKNYIKNCKISVRSGSGTSFSPSCRKMIYVKDLASESSGDEVTLSLYHKYGELFSCQSNIQEKNTVAKITLVEKNNNPIFWDTNDVAGDIEIPISAQNLVESVSQLFQNYIADSYLCTCCIWVVTKETPKSIKTVCLNDNLNNYIDMENSQEDTIFYFSTAPLTDAEIALYTKTKENQQYLSNSQAEKSSLENTNVHMRKTTINTARANPHDRKKKSQAQSKNEDLPITDTENSTSDLKDHSHADFQFTFNNPESEPSLNIVDRENNWIISSCIMILVIVVFFYLFC